ncbi:SDR family NAD(P)-dependent oxidoreductase [Castellaniella sp.]|uniref:SDR family NAD(P)-dependent oxidoreductase n=1 Tax=Castellaniella sp. TaxID=1955812 RepID=UPI003C7434B6
MSALKGKVAVVTGASTPSGIGLAIAKRFAQAGATLFLVADRTREQLDAARAACLAQEGCGPVETALLDLGAPGQAEDMIRLADERFGRVDVLVNNAGIRAPYDFGSYTRDVFDRVLAVNLASAFFASQAAIPVMRRGGGGRIIHIASQMGRVAGPRAALYGMTKAALIHLTKSMALELCRDNITVNSLSPGPIATQPLKDMGMRSMRELFEAPSSEEAPPSGELPDWNSQQLGKLPIGRLGQVDEVADVALYLAAGSPSFLMGQDVVVDGGYLLE